MAATTTMIHVRVDEQVKAQATETLATMGLSVSDAVRVFLMRVVADKQLPFMLKVPNAETRAAMGEADEISRKNFAMRLLILVPIIHTEQDMGSFSEQVKQTYVQKYGLAKWEQHLEVINELWSAIRQLIEAMALPYARIRLYQDGLPECGREEKLVKEMAGRGSKNHQLLLDLMQKGATLMGTESPGLLRQELTLLRAGLAAPPASEQADAAPAIDEGRKLLAERDHYIAQRINDTLCADEIGFLFLGMAHSIEALLPPDIQVKHLLPSLSAMGVPPKSV